MDDITLERYYHDPALRREIEAAARRERARQMQRLFEQTTRALRARHRNEVPAPQSLECCA